ncbi:unnamed protein product [Soboliphyme baturini]|uniref:Sm domain-containing protein n=1 Tax=Soboliphyme baturini TaxID=241478 RepID=A0A183IBJ9_9BILA|nr:unnamed protein product [Soboliphyme baturini]
MEQFWVTAETLSLRQERNVAKDWQMLYSPVNTAAKGGKQLLHSKSSEPLQDPDDCRKRWVVHFAEFLNKPEPPSGTIMEEVKNVKYLGSVLARDEKCNLKLALESVSFGRFSDKAIYPDCNKITAVFSILMYRL